MSQRDWLARAVEGAVNRYLGVDPDFARTLHPLEGRVIGVALEGAGVELLVHFVAEGVLVRRARVEDPVEAPAPDVHIRGTPLALARLAREGGNDPTLGGQVRIHGDIDVAQKLSRALADLEVDFEELLSRVTGDVTAHQVGRAVRGVGRFVDRARSSFERDLGEYLSEETALTPRREELEQFGTDVDVLRDDVERLEQRVRRLAARRGTGGAS